MVHTRIDRKTKENAAKTLAAMGISVSDAVLFRPAQTGRLDVQNIECRFP